MYLTVPCVELPLTSWLRSAFLAPHKSNGGSHAEGQTFARRRSHRSLRGRHGAAFQVLLNCLEENEAVHPGQFPEDLRVYMEMMKSKTGDVNDMTLAVLHDIRMATLD